MQRPRFQVSRAAEDQILHFLSGLRANFAKFFFPKIPAAARHHSQRPESHSNAMARHSGPARAARGTCFNPSHSSRTATSPAHLPRPESLAGARRSSLSTARFACRSPSHSQWPAVTRHDPPRAVMVVTRRGPPSLAAARLNRRGPVTRSCPSHSDGAAARLCSPQPASLTQ